jgi:all-trans-8'-apo-beta-carotenal 15,15'-oxygenase
MPGAHAALSRGLHGPRPAQVEGTIPPELEGTYLRNGPGLQYSKGAFQRHMFDGDGMVISLAFKDGRAFFRWA